MDGFRGVVAATRVYEHLCPVCEKIRSMGLQRMFATTEPAVLQSTRSCTRALVTVVCVLLCPNGGSAHVPVSSETSEVRCLDNHPLCAKFVDRISCHVCDVCFCDSVCGVPFFRCAECDCDMCESCYDSGGCVPPIDEEVQPVEVMENPCGIMKTLRGVLTDVVMWSGEHPTHCRI